MSSSIVGGVSRTVRFARFVVVRGGCGSPLVECLHERERKKNVVVYVCVVCVSVCHTTTTLGVHTNVM
jgi:hypothetical protein